MKIYSYDNFITEEDQNKIESYLTNFSFPWYFTGNINNTLNKEEITKLKQKKLFKNKNVLEYSLLHHTFYVSPDFKTSLKNSQFSGLADEILNVFKLRTNNHHLKIVRAKANLQEIHPKANKNTHSAPHRDAPLHLKHKVLIYYVNKSEGDTYIFDKNKKIKEKVGYKKGRFIFFDGSLLHSGGHPYKSPRRLIFNYNLIE
jgi:hypothetical protein